MWVCPAFAEKQQGDRCGWNRMREEERNGGEVRLVRRGRSLRALKATVRTQGVEPAAVWRVGWRGQGEELGDWLGKYYNNHRR